MTDCRLFYGHRRSSSPVEFSSNGEFSVAAAETRWAGSVRTVSAGVHSEHDSVTRAIAYVEMRGPFMRMREI